MVEWMRFQREGDHRTLSDDGLHDLCLYVRDSRLGEREHKKEHNKQGMGLPAKCMQRAA